MLDKTKPPPGHSEPFELQHVGCWHVRTPKGLTNCATSPNAALAEAWSYHEFCNDPPGMWTGYAGVLPDMVMFRPRMGAGLFEMRIPDDSPVDGSDAAKAKAREAAWARYWSQGAA